MIEIFATIVGGFLAAGAGWFLQYRAEHARIARGRKLLATAILDDLEHTLSIFDRIEDEWEKTKTVWFATLNELRESRQTFLNNKDWVISFEDPTLRKRVFRYYLKTSDIIGNLEYQQRRKYELQDKFNTLLRDIKFRTPAIADADARQSAVSFMQQEDDEYRHLEAHVPETLEKLLRQKQEAKDLAAVLAKS